MAVTESDYIKATNLGKISAALLTLRDVFPGKDNGISNAEMAEIMLLLYDAKKKLLSSLDRKN